MTDSVQPTDAGVVATSAPGDAFTDDARYRARTLESSQDARITARQVASSESVAPENQKLFPAGRSFADTRELVSKNTLPSMHIGDSAGGCSCCQRPPVPNESLPPSKMVEAGAIAHKGEIEKSGAGGGLSKRQRLFNYEESGAATYQVRSGDTILKIARAALGAAKGDSTFKPTEQAAIIASSQIADANKIEEKDMHLIRPDMPPLVIPKDVIGSVKGPADRVAVPGSKILENAGASAEFAAMVKQGVEKLSPEVLRLLEENGVKIIAAGEMADYDPNLARSRPRGWPPGSSWAEADGLQNGEQRLVVVAENTRNTSGNLVPSNRTQGVINHEVGHSVDMVLGQFSHSEAFGAAYEKDVRALSESDQGKYSYFLQGRGDSLDFAGREEACADVFAAIKGAASNSSSTLDILANFPETRQVIEARLGQLRQQQGQADAIAQAQKQLRQSSDIAIARLQNQYGAVAGGLAGAAAAGAAAAVTAKAGSLMAHDRVRVTNQ